MHDHVLKFYLKIQALLDSLRDEDGQDLVEYALILGLIALGTTAAMKTLATRIATAFGAIGTHVTTYTS